MIPRALGVALLCTAVGSGALVALGVRGPGRTTERFAALPFVDQWIRWDAGWYQGIATDGYAYSATEQSAVAYFPLYPLLIRGLFRLGLNPFLAGELLCLLFGLTGATLFLAWAREHLEPDAAALAAWMLLLWPFAFFLYGAVYSDALFLALVAGAFLCLERDKVGTATVLGALATATRPVAPALVVGLCARQLELAWRLRGKVTARDLLPLASVAGLLAYMAYLAIAFGDPLAFVKTQAGWGQLTGWRSWLKLPLFERAQRPADLLLPLLHAALALGCLALAWPMRRKLGWGYAIYTAAVVGIPLLTSRDFIGLGRYALAGFPCFAVAAQGLAKRPLARSGWLLISGALLAVMTAKFAMGRYVS